MTLWWALISALICFAAKSKVAHMRHYRQPRRMCAEVRPPFVAHISAHISAKQEGEDDEPMAAVMGVTDALDS
jgi:hypothetical protein